MPVSFNYPAMIERDESDRHVVSFPDFGWGATDGATLHEALDEAEDLLRELIAATMRDGAKLPEPSRVGKHRRLVVPPVQTAIKAALYDACRDAGISERQLAQDIDIAETEARRLLDPDHATKPALIERALHHFGKRLTVTAAEAG